ncbi:MAG: cytochrome c biogenesis protein CcsA [Deltaproteobacteria bacterium]|jgi:cytochrome c-type biogenesis protein CcmF|nr:cytochrome c biogenesis protein CcsA [Deltaproteobacteria bacterium]
MYIFAFILLVAAFLTAIFGSGAAAAQIWQKQNQGVGLVEKASAAVTALMGASSFILLAALVNNDFSLEYVAGHSDRLLPLFYRLTVFWAGQEGSILFWALSTSIFGLFFLTSGGYARLLPETRLWFWMFFLAVQGFFLLIITGWSNPFITLSPAPEDGQGLNPLLQNPGMIFHPPLLFLGYAGFAVPGCLALAQANSGGHTAEGTWTALCRPFILIAWIMLSAGIILGAWWAYMELGWGGYWAWDPVENASLLPWLIATAFLHTSVLEKKQGQLPRLNICLMGLTSASAFLATYIVRSGVVQSVHAFPDGGVGGPLLCFILLSLAVILVSAMAGRFPLPRTPLPDEKSLLPLLMSFILLFLTVMILVATLWPVISAALSVLSNQDTLARGLGAESYNRACLPLFAMLTAALAFCPWLFVFGWRRCRKTIGLLFALLFMGTILFFYLMADISGQMGANAPQPADVMARDGLYGLTAPLAAAAAVTALFSLILLAFRHRAIFRPAALPAHLTHAGLALMVLGVAFSGPYKMETEIRLKLGESAQLGAYAFRLDRLYEDSSPGYMAHAAQVSVGRAGAALGELHPQRRQYEKYRGQQFLESDTIFSLGNEIYVSLLSDDEEEQSADLRLAVNPLVNWIWVGGVLLCLAPLGGLRQRKKYLEEADGKVPAEEKAAPAARPAKSAPAAEEAKKTAARLSPKDAGGKKKKPAARNK